MIKNVTILEDTFLGAKIYDLGLGGFELTEGKWVIEIKKIREVRSLSQNRMYWGYVLTAISLETGFEVDELHEYFKSLMETKTIMISKTAVEIAVSTKKMDTKQFTEYIERIRQWTITHLSTPEKPFKFPDLEEITIDQIREMEELHSNRY